MAGLYMFQLTDQNYREYVQCKLKKPLENRYYEISLFVSAGEQSSGYENYSNCMQVYFSNELVSSNNYYALNFQPQWSNLDKIIDTSGWQHVSGYFKASGGEKYVTIGCFEDSSQIEIDNNDPNSTSDIYYALDDISVTEAPFQIKFPNVFSPNGDGINDMYFPIIENVPDYEVFIYNRWGNLIYTLTEQTPFWDGNNVCEGTYFYILGNETLEVREQGFFQLVR